MKKVLNETGVINELKGHSAFFPPKPPEAADSEPPIFRTPEPAHARTGVQAFRRTGERANGRAGQRLIKRESYNVYLDQHQALKRLEAEAMISGQSLGISELVRQALDDYLQTRKK